MTESFIVLYKSPSLVINETLLYDAARRKGCKCM